MQGFLMLGWALFQPMNAPTGHGQLAMMTDSCQTHIPIGAAPPQAPRALQQGEAALLPCQQPLDFPLSSRCPLASRPLTSRFASLDSSRPESRSPI